MEQDFIYRALQTWRKIRTARLRVGRWTRYPQGSATLTPVTGYWHRRSIMRQFGLSRADVGLREPWFNGRLPDRRAPIWISVLRKNSSVRRRVRAIAATSQQVAALDTLNKQNPNHEHYNWQMLPLLGRYDMPSRGTAPEFVHALVELHHPVENPTIACRVRVRSVHTKHEYAGQALARESATYPRGLWAVITYPVGEMLF